MRVHLRLFYVAVLFGWAVSADAMKLYWVGGTGNFNDAAHWSLSSGGNGGAGSPGPQDDVTFDEYSFPDKSVISIIGQAEVHDFIFTDRTNYSVLSGTQNEKVIVHGNASFNPWVDNQFFGQFWFKSVEANTQIALSHQVFRGDVYFDGNTNWTIKSNIVLSPGGALNFDRGIFDISNLGIYTTDFFAGKYGVTINTSNTTFEAKHKFQVQSGTILNDGKMYISARINDPTLYSIPVGWQFNSASRIIDVSTAACNVTLVSTQSASCPSGCDGVVVFNVSAGCSGVGPGNVPFCFTWNPSGCFCAPPATNCSVTVGNYTVTNVSACAGAYNVIVTDTAGSFVQSIGVPLGSPSPFSISFNKKQPTCNGLCNGYVIANLSGGTSPYTVVWNPGPTDPGKINRDTLKNACAGTYTVQINTDAHNCISPIFTVTLTQPLTVTATPVQTNVLCNGSCTGSITETVSGGTGPGTYTYTWAPATGTVSSTSNSSTYSNLCAGPYTFTVVDGNNCPAVNSFTITQPPPITFSTVPASGTFTLNCRNICNGSLTVNNVTGGTPGYTFAWLPAGGSVSGTANSSTYSNLCVGTYTCTIKDANNCSKTATFTITAPPNLSHTITATNPLCNTGPTGCATVTTSGGVGSPYTYTWTPAGGTQTNTASSSTYCNLSGGTYSVFSSDGHGCLDTAFITLVPPPSLTAAITTTIQPTCPNLNNGQLCVTAGGGTGPYTYSWTPPSAGTASCTPANLIPGTYTVKVTDSHSCTVTETVTLVSPPTPTVTSSVTNPPCNGNCNGTATLSVNGGTSPFTYTWTCSASVGPTIGGQCQGTSCSYTVTDFNSCKAVGTVTFAPVSPLTATMTTVTNPTCPSRTNGALCVTASGGTINYSYSWIPASGTLSCTPANLVAGNYTAIVTDAHSCTVAVTAALVAPPQPTVNPSVVNPSCSSSCNGTASLSVTGGTIPYTYTWSCVGTHTNTINGQCGGTSCSYSVVDSRNCIDTGLVNFIAPTALTGTMTTITNPTCPTNSNGQLCVTVGGGTGPFTYTWTPSAGTASCTPATLSAGNHTVLVTDANSCTVIVTASLSAAPQPTVNASITQQSCNGVCDGTATLTVTGGTGPFTYSWSCSASTTPTISGQCGGTSCSYTVTDFNSCKVTGTINFTVVPTITVTLNATSLTCASNCNAQITTIVNGGTPPIVGYSWTGTGANPVNPTSSSQINMCAGNYTCQVTDNRGCIGTGTATVNSPPPISVTLVPTNPTCAGNCNGSILANISGGVGPYATGWSPSVAPNPATTLNPVNLCAGTWTFTVTDANSCVSTATISLVSPPALTLTVNTSSVLCAGGSTGSATATATGGTGSDSFSWDGGVFGLSNITGGLSAGTHTVTVQDANGCTKTVFFTITQPTALSATATNIIKTCNGLCNGGATGNGSGGTPPYQYSWDNNCAGPFSASATTNTLCVGTHTLCVQDANGCISSTTFTVTQLVLITINTASTTVSCFNACDGTISASASGGVPPYNIQIGSTSCTNVTSCTATNLCPGNYTITATDANLCSSTTTFSVGNPVAVTGTVSASATTCFGKCSGTATVTGGGGTPGYTYLWSTGATTSNIGNLCSGTYSVTIKDAHGCPLTETVSVAPGSQFSVVPTFTNPTTCFATNGAIGLSISGGNPSYTVTWSPGGSTTNPLTGIPAGSYTASIVDSRGCDTVIVLGLGNTTGPTTNTVLISNASCFGVCNGSASVSGSGLNGPFTVTWPAPNPSGPSPQTGTNLCAPPSSSSPYLVQVTNSLGCISIATVTISSPTAIVPNQTVTAASCSGGTGTVTCAPTGGSGSGYTFNWDGSPGSNPETGLAAGTHTCIVSDGTGCTTTFTVNLAPPGSLTITVTANPALCFNASNGSASANITGGTSPFTYTWTNSSGVTVASGINVSNVSNLPAGNYTVSVVDAHSCASFTVFTIGNATAITTGLLSQNNICNTGCTGTASVSPTGGTGTYTVTWNTTPTQTATAVSNLCPGVYQVDITDQNNCSQTQSFTITAPPTLSVSIDSTLPSCFGGSNGTATVIASGGVPGYTVNWSPNSCPSCTVVTNLNAGTYTVTVTDANGCSDPSILTINNPPKILTNPLIVKPLCTNQCNGSVNVQASGGTGALSYNWVPAVSGNLPTAANLCAGTYTCIVTDSKNCHDTSAIIIANPPPIQINYSSTDAACGSSNGSITISSITGNGTVSVQWLNPVSCGSGLSCGSLSAGTYSLVGSDANGCKDTLVVPISNPNGPRVTLAESNVICNGQATGTLCITSIVGVNQVTPYNIQWTPPNGNSMCFNNLVAFTDYIVTVTDSLGCQTSIVDTIGQPPAIQNAPTVNNASCFGINNGSIVNIASGGTPGTTGYTYSVDGGPFQPSGTFNSLSAGTHTVCIKDSVSCEKCFVYNIVPTSQIVAQISSKNNTCAATCAASATITSINGGSPPYSTSWNDPGSQTGNIASGLCSGNFTATITDNLGCQATETVTITDPTVLLGNPVVVSPGCGQCNGSITLSPSGGLPGSTGYTYLWSNGTTSSTQNNVCAGPYQVTITDSANCKVPVTINISNTGAPTLSLSVNGPVCSNTCSGSATVTATGGIVPYSYFWPTGGQITAVINGQCSGNYIVQVKDSVGCIATGSVNISPNNSYSLSTNIFHPLCGVCNGSVTTSVSGGSGTYSYLWSPGGAVTPGISNVCAQNYTLVVTDGVTGCKDTVFVPLNSSSGPTLQLSGSNVKCFGSCTGTESVVVSGGTAPYTESWTNGTSGNGVITVGNLCPNSYAVQVTDAAGCVTSETFTVTQPSSLISALPILNQPLCNNNCNGSIQEVVSGGSPVYTYSWTPGIISGVGGSNLCAGNYSVIITDANGCAVTQSSTLVNPPSISITSSVTPASCNTIANAAITTTVTGGSPGPPPITYTYQWSGGSSATTFSIGNILPGTFTVMVTDSKGCRDSANFLVNALVSVTSEAGKDTTGCNLGNVVLTGTSVGGTVFQWESLPGNVNLSTSASITVTPTAGTSTQYVYIATNAGCTNWDTVTVNSEVLPVANAGHAVSIFTGNNTTIGGNPTASGTGTLTIWWEPHTGLSDTAASNPVASPTVTTTYTVYVKNSNGCVASDTVSVIILPVFVIPNGFSPNGDGINDMWQMDNIYLFPNVEVEVYNRWGEQLFYSKGYNTPWNGTYRGTPVPVGTYYYIIRLNDKRFPDHYAGPITILR